MFTVAHIVGAILGAQVATFVVFGGYFANFYGTSLAPLFVHWIVPLFGLTTYLLVANVSRALHIGRFALPVGTIMLVLFGLGRVERELRSRAALPPRPYPGRAVLEEMKGRSVVTYWISPAVSAYTHEWAAVLHDPRWRTIEPRDLPFDPERDFFYFFEADKANPKYRRPAFLFVPGINVPWLVKRRCAPLGGVIGSPVDGCSDLDELARRLHWLPLYRRGPGFLVYDLRPAYAQLGAMAESEERRGQ